MMSHPFFPKNLQPEETPFPLKAVSGRAKSNDRLARFQISVERLHGFFGRSSETRRDNHQVSIIKCVQSRNVLLVAGVDVPLFRINWKQHRAGKAVSLAENLAEHRQRISII